MERAYYGCCSTPRYLGAAWASSTESALQKLIKAQRDRFEAGVGLKSLSAEALSPEMYRGAYDDTNAQLRASYWLYVGSRLLLAKGKVSDATALAQIAYKRYHGAQGGWVFSPAGSGTTKIESILSNAAAWTDKYGLSEVSNILRALYSKDALSVAQQQKQDAHPITSLIDTGYSVAQNITTGTGKTPWGLYAVGGGVLLAVLFIAGRPYLAAAQSLRSTKAP